MRIFLLVLVGLALSALYAFQWQHGMVAHGADAGTTAAPTTVPAGMEQATFSAGCFWGVEEAFKHLKGVTAISVGYTGGTMANPTYEEVCSGLTGHAESVLITYDPKQISYAELLDTFWSMHDPTTLNRQGPDSGTNYRSAIFFHGAAQEKIARASLKEVSDAKVFPNPIVTEIKAAGPFYLAEEYHQDYFAKEGTGETCHSGVAIVHTDLGKAAAAARIAANPGK